MQSPYYRFIEIPSNFFDKEKITVDLSKNLDKNKNKHWNNLNHFFDASIFSFFSSIDYNLINSELFYTPPYGDLIWHIDMNPPEDFIKINFVWGSTFHYMLWGELKDLSKTRQTSKTEVDTQYIKLSNDEVILKESITIVKPALVNVGRPHKVLNHDKIGRWCLSLILTQNDQRILFENAVRKLSEYVVS